MTDQKHALKNADRKLQDARNAVSQIDIDALPSEISGDVRHAEIKILKAKGAVEVWRQS